MLIDVLDHGFVELVKTYGDEKMVVNAARVSFGRDDIYDKSDVDDKDIKLIRYLLRHTHTTPFEMCEMVFRIKLPMDVNRQLIRHRTASVNEFSTRYTEAIDENMGSGGVWRLQSTSNKQGSSGKVVADREVVDQLNSREAEITTMAREIYEERLAAGIAREVARKDLLLSNYTVLYWKMDLHNLMHFLRLRLDSHAQLEIRLYAQAISKCMEAAFPNIYRAFSHFVLGRVVVFPDVPVGELTERELNEFKDSYSRIRAYAQLLGLES